MLIHCLSFGRLFLAFNDMTVLSRDAYQRGGWIICNLLVMSKKYCYLFKGDRLWIDGAFPGGYDLLGIGGIMVGDRIITDAGLGIDIIGGSG